MADITAVLKFMDGWTAKARFGATLAVGAMAHETHGHCEDTISARDHSLAELAAMGHPYATRDPRNPHDPPQTVHVQSGALISGLQDGDVKATAKGATARVWNTEQPLDTWIQTGTPAMIARAYMEYVHDNFAAEIYEAGLAVMRKSIADAA
jgi:hypothetical protein